MQGNKERRIQGDEERSIMTNSNMNTMGGGGMAGGGLVVSSSSINKQSLSNAGPGVNLLNAGPGGPGQPHHPANHGVPQVTYLTYIALILRRQTVNYRSISYVLYFYYIIFFVCLLLT